MRITQNMLSETILKNLSSSYGRLEKYQSQLSSGKLNRRPSDDPIAVNQSINLRVTLKEMKQFKSNIEDGISWLDTADTSLRNATDLMTRVKELAVAGANATNGQDQLNAIAGEVGQVLESMINIGNTTLGGRYIFGGHMTTSAPFTGVDAPPTAVTYNGDDGAINYEIEKNTTLAVNLPGNQIFQGSTDVYQVLIDLRDHLLAGDYAAVSQDTDRVDDALGMITDALMDIGARTNRLETTLDRLDQANINLTELLSNAEDADMAEVIVQLKMEENVYNAALATGSSTMQKSLIDFLR